MEVSDPKTELHETLSAAQTDDSLTETQVSAEQEYVRQQDGGRGEHHQQEQQEQPTMEGIDTKDPGLNAERDIPTKETVDDTSDDVMKNKASSINDESQRHTKSSGTEVANGAGEGTELPPTVHPSSTSTTSMPADGAPVPPRPVSRMMGTPATKPRELKVEDALQYLDKVIITLSPFSLSAVCTFAYFHPISIRFSRSKWNFSINLTCTMNF